MEIMSRYKYVRLNGHSARVGNQLATYIFSTNKLLLIPKTSLTACVLHMCIIHIV